MTRVVMLLAAASVGLAGCASRPAAPANPRADVIVLLPDPEDERVGEATVAASGKSVTLAEARAATRVAQGRAPTAPATMSSDDVERLFGEALAARPLPPRQFLLYFRTGSDTLTPEAETLVKEIVEVVRSRPAPDVTVIGHTDTTGEPGSNYELGLRRAALIRDLLVASGLDPAQIDATSHGEAVLLVRTGDDAPEPRNRRVEVTIR